MCNFTSQFKFFACILEITLISSSKILNTNFLIMLMFKISEKTVNMFCGYHVQSYFKVLKVFIGFISKSFKITVARERLNFISLAYYLQKVYEV